MRPSQKQPEQVPVTKSLANLRTAVTGPGGFIGCWLVAALQSRGVSVLPLDGDIRSAGTWTEDFDLIYHLASVMPGRFDEDPGEAFSVNVNGVIHALEACRERNARMVFTSTCGVYSPKGSGALSEDHPLAPQTAYAQSKLMGEMLCRSYACHYGVKCTVFRLFNIYGAGQKADFVIPYLIRCGLQGSTAVVFNEESGRDFIHVKDVVEVMLRADLVDTSYSVFNLGSGRLNTIREIIDMVSYEIGRPLSWKRGKGRSDPHPRVYAKIERAVKSLEWFPKVNIKAGLRETVLAMSSGSS